MIADEFMICAAHLSVVGLMASRLRSGFAVSSMWMAGNRINTEMAEQQVSENKKCYILMDILQLCFFYLCLILGKEVKSD